MSTALSVLTSAAPSTIDPSAFFSRDQVDLIKRQIAVGVTDDELKLFLYQCARTGLDPFSRQIYAIVRKQWNPETRTKDPKMTIQTGIDGFRVIAERTKRYAPGAETVFDYDQNGKVKKATAFVKKLTEDGTWHVVSASAFYEEYVAMYEGKPQGLWSKPHIMLGKCAEAQALRRAFPSELSGIYTTEEMAQAGTAEAPNSAPDYTPPPGKGSADPKGERPSTTSSPRSEASPPSSPSTPPASSTPSSASTESIPDDGEAPGPGEVTALEDLVFKTLKWARLRARNWLVKHWNTDNPEAMTKRQIADAMALAQAAQAAVAVGNDEIYAAKVAELRAAGRIRPEQSEAA
jgi:phage recombination protein Bet